ncbi:MAG: TolB family protein [Prevotella sp.]
MRRPKTSSFCSWLWAVACWLLAIACSHTPTDVTPIDAWPDIYPDYVEVTIPTNIAPLNFAMSNDSISRVDVVVNGSVEGSLHANGTEADFDLNEWHQLLAANKGGKLTVTVCAERDGKWLRYRDFSIYISPDPLNEWGITYRRIAPGYEMYGQMGLYQRCLSDFSETALIENDAIDGNCINCHTANGTNPDQYVFHVRGDHGATVIHRTGTLEALQAKNDSLGGSMVYPYWHPGGRFVAFSTNKTWQMFHTANNKRIEVYDSSSDVFVYDTENHTILQDTLTMRKYWAENTPAFSPDGRWLYFTAARRQVYPTDYDKELYSLCRVSFDEATSRLGTQVDTLINAAETHKSATWPRPSYDGRFLMFTQTDYGYFSIWHPEADLWLLDLQTGAKHPLDATNSQRAESFHNWSHDSRWFLFTSRRDDGLYTRIYLSCIDENGNATKPVMLPQRSPKEYYRQSLFSYNTPDFTSVPVATNKQRLQQTILEPTRVKTVIK